MHSSATKSFVASDVWGSAGPRTDDPDVLVEIRSGKMLVKRQSGSGGRRGGDCGMGGGSLGQGSMKKSLQKNSSKTFPIVVFSLRELEAVGQSQRKLVWKADEERNKWKKMLQISCLYRAIEYQWKYPSESNWSPVNYFIIIARFLKKSRLTHFKLF